MTNDPELWSYRARSLPNPETGLPFMEGKTINNFSNCKRRFQNASFVVKITKPFLLFRGSLHAFPFLGILNVDKINGLHSLCLWIHHFLHLDRFLWPNHRDKIQRDQQNYWSLKQCIWHNFSMLAKSELVLTFWLSFYFQCPKNDNFGHLLSFKSVSQRVL